MLRTARRSSRRAARMRIGALGVFGFGVAASPAHT
jgi:hypothetical protein